MIKIRKKVFIRFMTVFICLVSIFPPNFSLASTSDVDFKTVAKAEVKNQIYDLLSSGYSPYYDILNLETTITEFKDSTDSIDVYALTEMKTVLKAKNASDLPYVKGMLKALNLTDADMDSVDSIAKSIKASGNTTLNDEQIAEAAKLLQFKVSDLEQYLGQPQDGSFFFKYSVKKTSNGIDKDTGKLYVEDMDSYFPAENIIPESSAKLESDGAKEVYDSINTETLSRSLYPDYDRLVARDYANTYTSNATAYCSHGKAQQNTSYWNTDQYPAYLYNFCHNDCADYVSQALNYGGIPKDSTWKRYYADNSWTYAWQNVRGLKYYMYNTKGYWKRSTYAAAAAGGVRLWKSGGEYTHIAMIVLNDTQNRKLSTHTNDRKRSAYSNESNREYYILW